MATGWESEGWWFDPQHQGLNPQDLQATFDPRLPKNIKNLRLSYQSEGALLWKFVVGV